MSCRHMSYLKWIPLRNASKFQPPKCIWQKMLRSGAFGFGRKRKTAGKKLRTKIQAFRNNVNGNKSEKK